MTTAKKYLMGYILSLLLVVIAFALVYIHTTSAHEIFSHPFLRISIITLALIQAALQLKFFLDLGGSRWNKILIFSTLGLILIIVVGSIWIMDHLNYNMSSQQIMQYMNDQSSF